MKNDLPRIERIYPDLEVRSAQTVARHRQEEMAGLEHGRRHVDASVECEDQLIARPDDPVAVDVRNRRGDDARRLAGRGFGNLGRKPRKKLVAADVPIRITHNPALAERGLHGINRTRRHLPAAAVERRDGERRLGPAAGTYE